MCFYSHRAVFMESSNIAFKRKKLGLKRACFQENNTLVPPVLWCLAKSHDLEVSLFPFAFMAQRATYTQPLRP